MTLREIPNPQSLPSLTVITVVLNDAGGMERTINSVLSQDYPHIEYIVIDGGSTDGTLDIIRQYRDRLYKFVSEPDEGIYDAMNKGIKLAGGEFILFMNCGDVLASPNAISSAMAYVQPGGSDQVLFGRWIRQNGNIMTPRRPVLEKGIFHHQAVIYSRNIHAWHGGYANIKGFTAADYLFFAALFASSRVACRTIDTELAVVDINGISAGLQTLSQKFAIDYICGRVTRLQLLMVLAAHPVYYRIKSFLGLRR